MTEQQRLSRKEIKHDVRDDAFRHGVQEGYQYVAGHTRLLIGVLVGILALVGVVIGARAWMGAQEREATDLLARAEKVLQAPIVTSDAKPDDEKAPSFPDAAARDARAKALLDELRSEHSGSAAADVAAIYLGRLRQEAGDAEGARALWQEFLDDHDDHLLSAGVRVSLIELDRASGKAQEVADRLRASLDGDDKELPEDVLLFELGRTLEELGKAEEAREAYQRLGDEYPDSPYASQAQAKARELGPQDPAAAAIPQLQLPS
jgi:tetratricopeptide (TPR) repeat protein